MKQFELIEIEGQPFERGQQYGSRAAGAIRESALAYLGLIEFQTGTEREAILASAEAFGPLIETHAPELMLEMQGIAKGAGCDLAQILLINVRSELMGQLGECTSLAATAEVTKEGGVLMGQNWDWSTATKPEPVLLRVRQPGKPELLTVTEPGQVGKIGLNATGLGVGLNFMSHTDRGQGLPVHIILRLALECEALGDAIHIALSVPRGGASNILLAHAQGEIIDLELTASREDYVYADEGWLVHANHFESQQLRGGDTGIKLSVSSVARAARARRLLSAAAGQKRVSLNTFRSILSDHTYGPYAICRHPVSSEPPMQRSATRASVIMETASGTLHVAAGQPCTEAYQPYRV